MNKQEKYIDIKTGDQYDSVPEGMTIVPNYESLSQEAQNQYIEYLSNKNPYELPELVVQGNSQGLPIIDPTETNQNLKVRDYNKKVDRWVNSEYSPENQFNNYTFGLLNRLSPTQNIGLAIDISQGDNVWDSMMGNSGIVSDQFYRDNPKLATGVNLLGDMIIPYSAYKTYQFVKPDIRNYIISRTLNKEIRNTTLPQESFGFNVGWGPRQTIGVTHASESPNPLGLYNPNRWDVINEGANPFGVWFQGKFGIPRSVNTGATPTKAQKALRARQLFSRRPYTHSGDLTLDKPLVTIGDVPNRSALSYQAEQMGADGLIYNNVYDNGYDANQVLLSFRHPDNYMLTARAYKGGPRKSSDYEFFTTDPKYAHNFGQVKPYYVRSKFPVVTDTPLMGSRDISTIDAFAHDIGGGRPIDAIIGHDKVTGEFPYISQGDEILIFNPNQARLIDESPRLSFQERQGIPKVERNFRTHGHDYSNPADYGRLYQGRSVNPESSRFGSFIDDGSEASVFQDPDNPNMVLKVNTDWRGSLQDFFDKYVTKRNRVPFQKPLIVRGRTQEGFPVFNQEKVTPMTDEQYLQNLPRIREMLHQKGFVGDLDQGYISNEDMTIGDFNPGNVAFDSKGNIVFIDIDAYKKGGKLNKRFK